MTGTITLEEFLIQFLIGACWATIPPLKWQSNVRMIFVMSVPGASLKCPTPLKGGYL